MKLMTKQPIDQCVTQTRQALLWAISTAILLVVVKYSTGLATHSMSIMASALDSTLDMMTSILNFFAFRAASKPPDAEHAYGHGKVESLAALFQSLLIAASGAYIIYESIHRLIHGSFVTEIPAGIAAILFSALVTLVLSWRLRDLAKTNKSLILGTEKTHYAMDFVAYAGVILALILVERTGAAFWDLIVSVMVALYIFYSSWEILRRAVSELLDRGLSSTELEKLRMLILRHHPAVAGIHNLRSRMVGNQLFLDFHVEIHGEDDFKKAHEITESLIDAIKKEHPGSDVTVHFDPEGEPR